MTYERKEKLDKIMVALLVIGLAVFILVSTSGCSSSGVKNDIVTTITAPDGTVTVIQDKSKTGGDIAAMQLALEIQAEKAETIKAMAMLDKTAQNTMMIRGDLWTDEYASYIRGEVAEGNQLRSGLTGGMWGIVGLAGAYGLTQVLQDGMNNGNTTTTTGPINITKSDDPVSGEGGSTGSIGGQSVVIGGGYSLTDQAQWASQVDKNMNAAFKDADSNLDGSGNPSGIVIDDRADGSGNETGLF